MEGQKPLPIRKGVYILPNLFTTGSLFSAFLGMIWAVGGDFEACAVAIMVSAVLDGLDGKVARLTNTASEFGVQYDSLADLAAFGLTPAIMLHQWQLQSFGRLGLVACFLFAACGALRLARFNVQSAGSSKKFFVGLPIPAAGCALASLVLFQGHLPEAWQTAVLPMFCLVLAYALSFLMVSRVRYASFKEGGLLKALPFNSLVTALLLFVLVASRPKLLGFPLFLIYVVSGPIYTFFILPRRRPKLLRESERA
jgi:CDP-diacylglycerol--serine O-phosphatidyltransferase